MVVHRLHKQAYSRLAADRDSLLARSSLPPVRRRHNVAASSIDPEKLKATSITFEKQSGGKNNDNSRAIGNPASMNAGVKSIADIMRRLVRAGAPHYIPK